MCLSNFIYTVKVLDHRQNYTRMSAYVFQFRCVVCYAVLLKRAAKILTRHFYTHSRGLLKRRKEKKKEKKKANGRNLASVVVSSSTYFVFQRARWILIKFSMDGQIEFLFFSSSITCTLQKKNSKKT
jgi:hypothetical protein